MKGLFNFWCLLIEFVIPNLRRIYFRIPEIFKTNIWNRFFLYKITFWICVLVLWIHKGYCVVKKLVWNVRIKAFLYTKRFVWCWGTNANNINIIICFFLRQYRKYLYYLFLYKVFVNKRQTILDNEYYNIFYVSKSLYRYTSLNIIRHLRIN